MKRQRRFVALVIGVAFLIAAAAAPTLAQTQIGVSQEALAVTTARILEANEDASEFATLIAEGDVSG